MPPSKVGDPEMSDEQLSKRNSSVTACGQTYRYFVSVHEEINEPHGEVEGALAQTQLAGHIPAPLHQLPPLGQLR